MPVRNGAIYLREAISSIQHQTLRQWELIVLDDGSDDDSAGIASGLAAEDERIRVVRLARVGVADAFNRGIEEARAPWVARMDADDVAMPERLERQLSFLSRNEDVAGLGTWGWIIGEDGRIAGQSRLGPTSREAFAKQRDRDLIYFQTPTMMFSREVALALGGFRREYSPSDDIDFWSRIADEHIVLALPEPLLKYRIHASNYVTREFQQTIVNLRWARVNMQRRRSGLPEWTFAEFDAYVAGLPRGLKIRWQLRDWSQFAYRRGGALLASGHPSGALWLLGSFIYPLEATRRLKRQAVFKMLFSKAASTTAISSLKPRAANQAGESDGSSH